MALDNTGIDPAALQRYLEEQIYTLPGTTRHRDEFSILLTGSRAIGAFQPGSDVDLDVVCPRPTYESVHRESLKVGIITAARSFFCPLAGEDWHRYFGRQMGCPHFSLTPLEEVERHLREFNDVQLWIWTNAKIITDPQTQFARSISNFKGYPNDVLIKKIKYRSLMAEHAGIDIYPLHHTSDEDLVAAANSISNMVSELLRLFFLVEGKPFPYAEKLMFYAKETKLGKEFCPLLQQIINLVVGKDSAEKEAWPRLDKALEMLLGEDKSEEARALAAAWAKAMLAAGVEPQWVEADYENIDELLSGELGPVP